MCHIILQWLICVSHVLLPYLNLQKTRVTELTAGNIYLAGIYSEILENYHSPWLGAYFTLSNYNILLTAKEVKSKSKTFISWLQLLSEEPQRFSRTRISSWKFSARRFQKCKQKDTGFRCSSSWLTSTTARVHAGLCWWMIHLDDNQL